MSPAPHSSNHLTKQLQQPKPTEGTPASEIARLQFKLPPPQKPARRSFLKTDRVEALYAYVESLVRVIVVFMCVC